MDREFIEKLLMLYPMFDKVYGPYKRKDNRKHIILCKSDLPKKHRDKLKTLSYPKALVEVRENRILEDFETVDHIDEDFTNNDIDNLQILTRMDNIQKSFNLNPERNAKLFEGVCEICSIKFTKSLSQVLHNMRLGRKGPFCSRKCAGKYSMAA